MRHVRLLAVALLLALAASGLAIPGGADAQAARCFPETGQCIGGRFRQFWEQNGGLAVFGFPISSELVEQGRTVQYFERQRFELHPENQPPYDVLLGRLGAEALQARGVDWRTQPTAPGQAAGCLYFPETHHNICNQQPGVGFLNQWTTHGLEFDGRAGKTYPESLALFGLPITEPYQYTDDRGQTFQAQWFERARFEWHPENPTAYKVLLGRLGAEQYPAAPPTQPAYDKPTSPVDLLASFYNAVNRQEYQRAYTYWETPPSSYDDFARGYADTASVQLIVEPPTRIEGAAGNLYAQVPTVLVAAHHDGSQQTFAGCYTTHAPNLGPQANQWRISNASIAPAPSGASVPALLVGACPAQPADAYDKRDSPVDLLASFYNAVDRQEYQRAYTYWEMPPSSYDDFARGYADTASVRLIVAPPVAWDPVSDRFFARVPTVLLATNRDGSQHLFAGCYVTSSPRQAADWRIFPTTTQIAPAPDNVAVPTLLGQQC